MENSLSIKDYKSARIETKVSRINTSVRWDSTPPALYVIRSGSERTEDMWYQKEDLESFMEQCEVSRVSANKLFPAGECVSFWGLEHTICEKLQQNRSNRKREAFDVVMDEQENQREDGECLPDYIAEIYKDITRISQLEAHEQALRYRKELNQEAENNRTLSQVDAMDAMHIECSKATSNGKRKSYATLRLEAKLLDALLFRNRKR